MLATALHSNLEIGQHLEAKLLKLTTVLGRKRIKEIGFKRREDFVLHHFNINTTIYLIDRIPVHLWFITTLI